MFHLDNKFIFTHVPKCGGGSLRRIFTNNKQFKPKILDEEYPKQRFYGCGPYHRNKDTNKTIDDIGLEKHGSITDYIKKLQELGFNHEDFLKISIIRNPWDRAVSYYYHIKSSEVRYWHKLRDEEGLSEREKKLRPDYKRISHQASDQFTFNEFLNKELYLRNISSHEKMFYKEKYIVDFVVRYENYEKDVFNLMKKLEVKYYDLKKINYNTTRPLKDDYRSYYNKETKQIISNFFEEEIDLFNYTFENGIRR